MASSLPRFLVLAALIPAAATAQSAQRFSAQGSVLRVSLSGDAYSGLDAGMGFEAQIRYTPSAFSLGAGFQTSGHQLTFDDGSTEDVTLAGPFLEPRYVLALGSESYAPYLSGRLAFLTQSLEFEGVEASTSGTQINLGGGVLVRVTPRINFDVGFTYGAIDFDDVEVVVQGITYIVEGTSGSGKNLVLRLGATLGL